MVLSLTRFSKAVHAWDLSKKIGAPVLVLVLLLSLAACSNIGNQGMSVLQQETPPRLLTLIDYHHPLLRQEAKPIQFPLSAQDKQLITDMKYSIQAEQLKKAGAAYNSAAGMAANQWGVNKQIFIFCPDDSVNGLEVIINPSYEAISKIPADLPSQDLKWEGCFSIPLAAGNMKRHLHIRVKYQNEDGKTIIRELHDWSARVWQHENDHLNGLLYDDCNAGKCIDKRQFSSKEEEEQFYATIKKEEQKSLGTNCPCDISKHYKDCCEVYLTNSKHPDTPEQLMRSRYSAYAKRDMDYIQKTMRGLALFNFNKNGIADDNHEEWLQLDVISSYYDPNPNIGYVEFIAKYKLNDLEKQIHELSKFQRENGRWYYTDGTDLP